MRIPNFVLRDSCTSIILCWKRLTSNRVRGSCISQVVPVPAIAPDVRVFTSNVTGVLEDQYSALDALRVSLPVGTVSGAPKVRAMQIIDELEKEKRGLYAGCVGYFSATGDMDSCIVLHTALATLRAA